MNPGKISNTILARSVLKNIQSKSETVAVKPGIGKDCAVMRGRDTYTLATVNSSIGGITFVEGACYRAVNNLAAAGARPLGLMADILYNRDFNEPTLKNIVKRIDRVAGELGTAVAGGSTRICGELKSPIVSITGVGVADVNPYKDKPQNNDSIIVTKDIGIEGINMIATLKSEEILKRYSQIFFEDVRYKSDEMSIVPEAAVAIKHGVTAMHDISEGGILSALWDLCETYHAGCSVSLKKIPVKQSTVEVCEMFDINPYYLISGGALLITAHDGDSLVAELNEAGIKATIIGKITDSNDKIIMNDTEVRYLDTPQKDEIYKII